MFWLEWWLEEKTQNNWNSFVWSGKENSQEENWFGHKGWQERKTVMGYN